jgi:hypothetical protein
MTLTHEEFLRRFPQDVLPVGFPRIRYFGPLPTAVANCSKCCLQCAPDAVMHSALTDLGNVFGFAEACHTNIGDNRLLVVGPNHTECRQTGGPWPLRKAFSGQHAILCAGNRDHQRIDGDLSGVIRLLSAVEIKLRKS